MKLISHRGNINGPIKLLENNPEYIDEALVLNYDVEIDIWVIDSIIYTGHDAPSHKIDLNWILERKKSLWIHAKNISSLEFMSNLSHEINYFWHQKDDVVLTSKKFLWTYPGKELTRYSIAVLPELIPFDNILNAYGICSDFISHYKIS